LSLFFAYVFSMEALDTLGTADIFVAVTVFLLVASLAVMLLAVIFAPLAVPIGVLIGLALAVPVCLFRLLRFTARGILSVFRHPRLESPPPAR
jgi:hypothetical protein